MTASGTIRRTLLLCTAAALLTAVLTGCRKDLCYDHETHGYNVTARVLPEWELEWRRDMGMQEEMDAILHSIDTIYRASSGSRADDVDERSVLSIFADISPKPAAGIASVSYHESGVISRRHLGSDGGLLHLMEGTHDLMFYNNDTEYILFDAIDTYAEAVATTRTRTRATFNSMFEDEVTVNSPDMLYGAWVEDYEGVLSTEADSLQIWMRPLVYTYLIVYHFDQGIEHVRSACGSLSGMAGQVYLRDGHTGDDAVTILFDDCAVDTVNHTVVARVRSFGIPGYSYGQPVRSPGDPEGGTFSAGLEVMLPNGELWNHYDDISSMMRIQPRGGIIVVSGLSITDEEAAGDSMFDVSVGGWEDYGEDIILPL